MQHNKILSFFFCLITNSIMAQWELLPTGNAIDWRAVYFVNDSSGFVVGNTDTDSYIIKTVDYGAHWDTVLHEGNNFYYDVHFPSEAIGYVSNYHNVLKTIDGGETWFYLNAEANLNSYWGIHFVDDNVGFGCFADGGDVISKTVDGAENWMENTAIGAKQIISIDDCSLRGISNQVYLKTENCGDSWEISLMSLDNNRTFSSLDNSSNGINACGIGGNGQVFNFNYGTIAFSANDGASWVVQDFPHAWRFNSIFFPSEQTGYCVGEAFETFPDVILKTVDGGNTWNYQEYDLFINGDNPNLIDVYCPSVNVCYAIGYSGQIYRTMNGGGQLLEPAFTTNVQHALLNELFITPNPVHDILKIQHLLFQDVTKLKIFDATGRIFYESSYPNEIYVGDYEMGIYFLSVQVGDTIFCAKWMKD